MLDSCFGFEILGALALPSRLIRGVVEQTEVLPVERHAARRVRSLDEYSMRGIPGDKVGFARIEEFKGLENEAIVVVDLPALNGEDRNEAAHYVAMSRARSVLSLIHRDSSGAMKE